MANLVEARGQAAGERARGEQRVGMGLANLLVEDSVDDIAAAVRGSVLAGTPAQHRSEQVEVYRQRISVNAIVRRLLSSRSDQIPFRRIPASEH